MSTPWSAALQSGTIKHPMERRSPERHDEAPHGAPLSRAARWSTPWSAALQSGTMEHPMERRSPQRHDEAPHGAPLSRAARWSTLWSAALQSGTMEHPMERRSPERHDGAPYGAPLSRAARWSTPWSAALQSGTMEHPMERRSPERHDGAPHGAPLSRAARWSTLWSAALQSGTMERRPSGCDVEQFGFPVPLWRAALHAVALTRPTGSDRTASRRTDSASSPRRVQVGSLVEITRAEGPRAGTTRLKSAPARTRLTGAVRRGIKESPAQPSQPPRRSSP